MKTIGLVMIVKNESRSLEKCLSLAQKLVDEIYITDTGSTDNTVEIAEKFHAHISKYEWNNDFAAARNYALEQSTCDWNLILDADEYLISGSKKDLLTFIENGSCVGAIQLQGSKRRDQPELPVHHPGHPKRNPLRRPDARTGGQQPPDHIASAGLRT